MSSTLVYKLYEQVDVAWIAGETPTVKATLTDPNTNLPVFHYVNDNTTDANGNVQSSIELFRSTNGPVEAGNLGTKGSVTLNSQGYSSGFFFEQIAKNLTEQLGQFKQVTTTAPCAYVYSFEIYYPPFGPLTDSAVLRQNKGYGASGNVCVSDADCPGGEYCFDWAGSWGNCADPCCG